MDAPVRRKVLIVAVSAPLITALVMGALIVRKVLTPAPTETPPPAAAADPRADALFKLVSAGSLPPDEMVRAADDAERAAGTPLVEACLVRVQAARKKRDPSAERAAIDKALSIDPSNADAQLARALAAVDSWARDAAPLARVFSPETTLGAPLLVPPSPGTEPGLDKLAGRAGEVVRLLAVFRAGGKPDEVAPIWSSLSAGGVEDRLAFAVGVHSLRLGAPDDALPWLRTAVSSTPDDPARLRCAALAALLAGEAREALGLVRRWSESGGEPKPAEALGWWAVAARKLGDVKEARVRLDEAAKIDPAWRSARGWLAYQAGDLKQALEDAEARRESDPWARYLRALLHWDAGDVDAALAESAKLLEGWPDHYEALVLQARGQTVRGRNEKAEELWKHAMKFAAGRTEAKLGLAEFYATTGRKEEAITAFLEIPGLAVAHWRGAQLMLDLGRHAEALRWVELGVDRYPDDVRVRTTFARILHARLDHFGERAQLERAAQLGPADAETKKLLADCIAEMKRD
jgi:tetratricopeptide (TPR) repeat protein